MICQALLASTILAVPFPAYGSLQGQAAILLPQGYLGTSRRQIIDASGNPVRITSIGWNGMNPATPQTLPQPSPDGTSLSLDAPPDPTSLVADGDTELSGADGSHFINVTNQGNVVVETSGQQIVRLDGDYNATGLGPYDDVVVVSDYGNTINAGGGVNTIIIQPPPPPSYPTVRSGLTVAQEQAMSARLGNEDRLDLTQTLAGAPRDHSMATIRDYVTTNRTQDGLVVLVSGKIVAVLVDGVPGNYLTPYLTAQ